MAERGPVAELFAPLLPDDARFAVRAIEGEAPALFPEEEIAVRAAHERRRRPFAFGRACAREALGIAVAIPVGHGGGPVWPAKVVGSITHTDEHAAAVVREGAQQIGIDLESLAHAAQTPALLTMVATPAERAAFARMTLVDQAQLPALVFSAKESIYKCVYPMLRRFLDFHDVELHLDLAGFTTRVDGISVRGRFAIDDTHVATVALA